MSLRHETYGLSLPVSRSFLDLRARNALRGVNWFHNAKYSLYLARRNRNRKIIAEENKPISKKETKQMQFIFSLNLKEGDRMTYLWIFLGVDSSELLWTPFNSVRQRKRNRGNGVSISFWLGFRSLPSFRAASQPVALGQPLASDTHPRPVLLSILYSINTALTWNGVCSRISYHLAVFVVTGVW